MPSSSGVPSQSGSLDVSFIYLFLSFCFLFLYHGMSTAFDGFLFCVVFVSALWIALSDELGIICRQNGWQYGMDLQGSRESPAKRGFWRTQGKRAEEKRRHLGERICSRLEFDVLPIVINPPCSRSDALYPTCLFACLGYLDRFPVTYEYVPLARLIRIAF